MKDLLNHLIDNPCRGIIAGRDLFGNGVQIFLVMGRSEKGKNRKCIIENESAIATRASDAAAYDESLTFTVMTQTSNSHIVSNWNQTSGIYQRLKKNDGKTPEKFFDALGDYSYALDAPVFTPRISACHDVSNLGKIYLSLIKKGAGKQGSSLTERFNYSFGVDCGSGYCITTYMPGSETLPSFSRDPILINIDKPLDALIKSLWESLDDRWRVSIVGKSIYRDNSFRYLKPINKFG